MNDIIDTIALAGPAVALVAAAGLIARAWLVSRAKRRRLAAAYTYAPAQDARPREHTTTRPSISDAVGGAGGGSGWRNRVTVRHDTPVERGPFHRPTAPASPSTVYYGDPVPLDLSSVAGGSASDPSPSTFSGDGGSFGGGGASGGWDSPSSGDSGGGSSGGDSGGSSSD
jgi:hypothetical protein